MELQGTVHRFGMEGPRNRFQHRTTVYYKCFSFQSLNVPFKHPIVQWVKVYFYFLSDQQEPQIPF